MSFNLNRFLLSSDECELLLFLEESTSPAVVAEKMGRDGSVVSRSLKRISEKLPVVEKRAGRWVLTDLGRNFNEASRAFISTQLSLTENFQVLKIGTNREFAARMLAPQIHHLQRLFPKTQFSFYSYENGTEKALLQAQVDVAIDCGRPGDPDIAYQIVVDEPIIAVASKNFYKHYRREINHSGYLGLPHLLCDRLHPDKVFLKGDCNLNIIARFNDIASTRASCVEGIGWALLPRYSVQKEIKLQELVQIDEGEFGLSKYGIWWLRHRRYLKPSVDALTAWLKTQEL